MFYFIIFGYIPIKSKIIHSKKESDSAALHRKKGVVDHAPFDIIIGQTLYDNS